MEKLITIRTLAELEVLKDYLADKTFVAVDTETTGVDKDSEVIGFSVAAEPEVGFYVILSYWDVPQQKLVRLETYEGAKAFMQTLTSKSLIMQNGVFDCSMIENNFQVRLMPYLHTDTLILGHLLNENRSNGLKERGVELFGEDARAEQLAMKESVLKNGGQLTKKCYELYKADADLIALYGAKDAILTYKVWVNDVDDLYAQGLDKFFYDDESMPLLRGPTYDLNTTGLRIDPIKLQELKTQLESDCIEAQAFIHKEIAPFVSEKYPGTRKANTFNIGASKQLAWLLFVELDNDFYNLTKGGREVCKQLGFDKLPYTAAARADFITACRQRKGEQYEVWKYDPKVKRYRTFKSKIGDPWNYMACGKETLAKLAPKYKWVQRLLEYAKNKKLLTTYVIGIQERMRYNVIRPSFLQHGTTSGRYSSRAPNFQNLPRDDKRVKTCIVSRPGKVFVGADYAQLEPRVFASFSGDKRLLDCFKNGDDFYSVIGMEVFEKYDCTLKKDDADSFAKKYPLLRNIAKVVALSSTYGTTPAKMAPALGKSMDECAEIIYNYFEKFPSVKKLMLDAHEQAKDTGRVENLFGRPRRMPAALDIRKDYGNATHGELPYEARNLLNLAINHRIQSTGASIMNRAATGVWQRCRELEQHDPRWADVKIVLQVHDELILEAPEALASAAAQVLKDNMEGSVNLPGVALIAEPNIVKCLADLK